MTKNTHRKVLKEALYLRGDLEIVVLDVDNKLLRRICKRNTITYNGLNAPLYLLAQNTGVVLSDYGFAKLVPGTNNTPPTRGDLGVGAPLGLSDQITLLTGNKTVSPTTGELIVTGTLTTAQGNGNNITEIGLILGNGSCFARQIHPTIAKTSSFSLGYTWRFALTTSS